MGPQRLRRGVGAGEFAFGQRRVNLAMAQMVQENRRPTLASLGLGDQVMEALVGIGRDRPPAEGADRVPTGGHGSCYAVLAYVRGVGGGTGLGAGGFSASHVRLDMDG